MSVFRDSPKRHHIRWWHWLFLCVFPTREVSDFPTGRWFLYKQAFGRMWILHDHWD